MEDSKEDAAAVVRRWMENSPAVVNHLQPGVADAIRCLLRENDAAAGEIRRLRWRLRKAFVSRAGIHARLVSKTREEQVES